MLVTCTKGLTCVSSTRFAKGFKSRYFLEAHQSDNLAMDNIFHCWLWLVAIRTHMKVTSPAILFPCHMSLAENAVDDAGVLYILIVAGEDLMGTP
jgi:hypothetical protein